MATARELGIEVGGGKRGPLGDITDVAGVTVGHTTLISGDGPRVVGQGPVRTGVTVVLPAPPPVWRRPVFAGWHRLNGDGEVTGLHWIAESGLLTSPIGLTNTHSLGVVRDALIQAEVAEHESQLWFSLPIVAETYDGRLNDINGMHVKPEHVFAALAAAAPGPIPQGSVGGGTGMVAHGFKGGIGSASRVTGSHTVGVLVQANHGRRERFRVNGVPVGEIIGDRVPAPAPMSAPASTGSIIVVAATDAPLLPHQLNRIAQRAVLGIARTGGAGEHTSGDFVIAFSTAHAGRLQAENTWPVEAVAGDLAALPNADINPLFDAVIEATEEAILNAMLASETMTGCDGVTVHALPHDLLLEALRQPLPNPPR